MNLRSGKIKDNNLHIPRRQRAKTMTNTTNHDRGQNPPQGASTIVSSSIDASSTIPVGSSNTVPVSALEVPTAPHSGSQLYSTRLGPQVSNLSGLGIPHMECQLRLWQDCTMRPLPPQSKGLVQERTIWVQTPKT